MLFYRPFSRVPLPCVGSKGPGDDTAHVCDFLQSIGEYAEDRSGNSSGVKRKFGRISMGVAQDSRFRSGVLRLFVSIPRQWILLLSDMDRRVEWERDPEAQGLELD